MTTIGWVLYDGTCAVCSRWVPFWARTLARIGLDTAPLQSQWVRAQTGMSDELLLKDIRVLLKDGTLYSGAEAYFYCMKRIWWAWPLYVVFELPVFNAMFRLCYRAFAQNRYKISRVCRLKTATNVSCARSIRVRPTNDGRMAESPPI